MSKIRHIPAYLLGITTISGDLADFQVDVVEPDEPGDAPPQPDVADLVRIRTAQPPAARLDYGPLPFGTAGGPVAAGQATAGLGDAEALAELERKRALLREALRTAALAAESVVVPELRAVASAAPSSNSSGSSSTA